jgi:hypothetical protein
VKHVIVDPAKYTFDASAKTVQLKEYLDVYLGGLLIIVNVTDQIIIFNLADTTKGGTVVGNIVTLEYDTSSMDDLDKLQIIYDDGLAKASSDVTAEKLSEIVERLGDVVTELRVLGFVLNEGLNTKEDLETLRNDVQSEME